VQVLSCTCGDCTHWELLKSTHPDEWEYQLKCVTCGVIFPLRVDDEGGIVIPEADHLEWK
jgi:hypothetical protein